MEDFFIWNNNSAPIMASVSNNIARLFVAFLSCHRLGLKNYKEEKDGGVDVERGREEFGICGVGYEGEKSIGGRTNRKVVAGEEGFGL